MMISEHSVFTDDAWPHDVSYLRVVRSVFHSTDMHISWCPDEGPWCDAVDVPSVWKSSGRRDKYGQSTEKKTKNCYFKIQIIIWYLEIYNVLKLKQVVLITKDILASSSSIKIRLQNDIFFSPSYTQHTITKQFKKSKVAQSNFYRDSISPRQQYSQIHL